MESIIKISILLLIVTSTNGCPESSSFLCYRDNLCGVGGDCMSETGRCNCNDGMTCFDCSQPSLGDCIDSSVCDVDHTVGCNRVAGDDVCMCELGWKGEFCDIRVSSLVCDGTNMVLTYKPTASFTGDSYVYPVTEPYDSTCVTRVDGETFSLPMVADACGVTRTEVGTLVTHEAYVMFQYQSDNTGRYDDVVLIRCMFDSIALGYSSEVIDVGSDLSRLHQSEEEVKDDQTGPENPTATTYTKAPLDITWIQVTSQTSAKVADLFKIVVTLDDGDRSVYGGIRLEKCYLDDGGFGGTPRSLIIGGCVITSNIGYIYELNREPAGSKTQIFITAYVMKYETSDVLRLICDVRRCHKDELGQCEDESCDPHEFSGILGVDGTGRRRRDASSINRTEEPKQGDVTQFKKTISVDGLRTSKEFSQQPHEDECQTSRPIIATIAMLCVLILVFAVVSVLFTCKSLSLKRTKVDDASIAYSKSQRGNSLTMTKTSS